MDEFEIFPRLIDLDPLVYLHEESPLHPRGCWDYRRPTAVYKLLRTIEDHRDECGVTEAQEYQLNVAKPMVDWAYFQDASQFVLRNGAPRRSLRSIHDEAVDSGNRRIQEQWRRNKTPAAWRNDSARPLSSFFKDNYNQWHGVNGDPVGMARDSLNMRKAALSNDAEEVFTWLSPLGMFRGTSHDGAGTSPEVHEFLAATAFGRVRIMANTLDRVPPFEPPRAHQFTWDYIRALGFPDLAAKFNDNELPKLVRLQAQKLLILIERGNAGLPEYPGFTDRPAGFRFAVGLHAAPADGSVQGPPPYEPRQSEPRSAPESAIPSPQGGNPISPPVGEPSTTPQDPPPVANPDAPHSHVNPEQGSAAGPSGGPSGHQPGPEPDLGMPSPQEPRVRPTPPPAYRAGPQHVRGSPLDAFLGSADAQRIIQEGIPAGPNARAYLSTLFRHVRAGIMD